MREKLQSITIEEWKEEQDVLRRKICLDDFDISTVKYVAGIDIAYTTVENQEFGCCCIVVIDYTTLEVVEMVYFIQIEWGLQRMCSNAYAFS